jgi:hypothetical protein
MNLMIFINISNYILKLKIMKYYQLKRALRIILVITMTITALPFNSMGQNDRLGHEWSVTEAVTYTGRWVRRGNSEIWDATWNNGAVAELSISIRGDKVRISRRDVGGPSIGFTSIYEGTLAPDGTMQGTETGTWPGHFTNKTFDWQGRIVTPVNVLPPPANPISIGEDRLGHEWSVTEAVTYTGRWVRRGNSKIWDATWNNGAVAELSISIRGDKVRISRRDVGGPSIGFTSIYEGTLAPDGTMQGTETGTWPGHFTNKTFDWQGRIVSGVKPTPL